MLHSELVLFDPLFGHLTLFLDFFKNEVFFLRVEVSHALSKHRRSSLFLVCRILRGNVLAADFWTLFLTYFLIETVIKFFISKQFRLLDWLD